jgi:hypothetical protein
MLIAAVNRCATKIRRNLDFSRSCKMVEMLYEGGSGVPILTEEI